MSRRPKLFLLSLVILCVLITIGTVVFGQTPPSKTDFLILAFIGAWCLDAKEVKP